jgi:hypothetical protein
MERRFQGEEAGHEVGERGGGMVGGGQIFWVRLDLDFTSTFSLVYQQFYLPLYDTRGHTLDGPIRHRLI